MSKEDMWDVARCLQPDLTWVEFEDMWERFVEMKKHADSCGGTA